MQQQWEYAEIKGFYHECFISYRTPDPGEVKIEPGEPGEEVPGILTKKMIAWLGIAGWEMVNVAPQVPQTTEKDLPTKYDTSLNTWHFKRLVEQHPKTSHPFLDYSIPYYTKVMDAQGIKQRWEYAEIQSMDHECSLLYYRSSQHPGFTLKASEPDEQMPGGLAKKLIDQLARHGWEVVSHIASQQTWYLKHLLDEDRTPEWVEELLAEQKKQVEELLAEQKKWQIRPFH